MLKIFWYAGQAPTNLMVRQIGIRRVRVSWTPPPNPPRNGYRITTSESFSAGITVASTASGHEVSHAPGTVMIWLVVLYGTQIVVGPVSGTVRGKEM